MGVNMGVNIFFILLFVGSFVFFATSPAVPYKHTNKHQNKAQLVFTNSKLYEITQQNVQRIIYANKAYIYNNHKQVLHDATIITKEQEKTNILVAQKLVKTPDLLVADKINLKIKVDK